MLEPNPAYPADYHIRILLLVQVQHLAFRVSGFEFGALGVGLRVAGCGFGSQVH